MGHGMHGLLANAQYPLLSGTETPRDFVEFPSTFHEDWAIDPAVLGHFARHYQTGAPIPADLVAKVVAAAKFNKAHDTYEYLAAALLDLSWHELTPEQIPTDVEGFEAQVLQDVGLNFGAVPPRYRSQYFDHIWAGGYASSYYAYLWSEILAADAFAYMKTQGGLTRENDVVLPMRYYRVAQRGR